MKCIFYVAIKCKRRSVVERRSAKQRRTLLSGLSRRDADEAAALAFVVELNDAVDLGEERVVAADADVHTGVELRSPLTDENRSTGDELSGEALHSEHLRLRVT